MCISTSLSKFSNQGSLVEFPIIAVFEIIRYSLKSRKLFFAVAQLFPKAIILGLIIINIAEAPAPYVYFTLEFAKSVVTLIAWLDLILQNQLRFATLKQRQCKRM